MFVCPTRAFQRMEDTGAYGWALLTLLVLVTLIGYLHVQTGLIDQLVDEGTATRLAAVEAGRSDLVDRVELAQALKDVRKEGEFLKTMSRIQAIALSPAYLLGAYLFIASLLFAMVALTGRKPEFHTLMSICVYAGFIELIACGLRVAMMLYYRSSEVGTTLRMLSPGDGPTVWAAIDPFRIWFWVLVGMGLVVTEQLSRRAAIVSVSLMALAGTGLHVAAEFAAGAAR